MILADAIAALEKQFPILAKKEFRNETTLTVESGRIAEVCAFAKNELGFNSLANLCSVDNFGNEPRFEVVYDLYSFADNHYLRFKTTISEDEPSLPSVAGIWNAADWHEREVYDMMGIRFNGHPDLRRILMWDGYPYHPLRKDFPLGGRPSEMPDVAFTKAAPLEGGPFVTTPCAGGSKEREPRSKRIE
ncbi:MAG: NADH-quinone oxidoreductase subunit C [Verrucomicrobia bacterium]|nr:NADH-quinone oxidoreductase subunit C [Verrucomicrobiota bacterium]